MRITIEKDLKVCFLYAVVGILYGTVAALLKAGWLFSVIIGVLAAAVFEFRIHISEKAMPVAVGPICAVSSVGIFFLGQMALGLWINRIGFFLVILNVLVVMALEGIVYAISGSVRVSVIVPALLTEVLAIIDNLVVQARSLEFSFGDIWSIPTAMSVVEKYTFTLRKGPVMSIMITVLLVLLFIVTGFPKTAWKKRIRLYSLGGAAVLFAAVVLFASTPFGVKAAGIQDRYWKFQGSQYNGFYVRLVRSVSATVVKKPKGYSKDRLDDLVDDYLSAKTSATNVPATEPVTGPAGPETTEPSGTTSEPTSPATTGGTTAPATTNEPLPTGTADERKRPNVIVVMDETLADLQAVSAWMAANGYGCEELQTDIEVLPFLNSLDSSMSNVEKGWAMASVFGGNTANSEFEFLTGNTMAFLPVSTVAYSLYLNEGNAFSLADLMQGYGYRTVAMHPELATNWNRSRVYRYYGFDEMYFIDDFSELEEDYYRTHVSDAALFRKIIELFEEKEEDTPLFTFAVTMMNHGGYNTAGFEYTVDIPGHSEQTDVREYLSSIRETDAALRDLISYFSECGEDTVIVVFGDHQPSLSDSFYTDFFGVTEQSEAADLQSKYVVPYLIWANYDFEDGEEGLTSFNYLGARTAQIAGLKPTRYMDFLLQMKSSVPAITANGYWTEDGQFYTVDAETGADHQLIQLYRYLQYNELFDSPENKLYDWFSNTPERWKHGPEDTTGTETAPGTAEPTEPKTDSGGDATGP